MSAAIPNAILIRVKVFETVTQTGSDFPWRWGTFAPGAAFREFESFLVPLEGEPDGECLDLMALESSGVSLSELQWGLPDQNGATYLWALHLYKDRKEASWSFGPHP